MLQSGEKYILGIQRKFPADGASQGAALQRPFSISKTSLAPTCPHGPFINPKLSSQAFEAVLAFSLTGLCSRLTCP